MNATQAANEAYRLMSEIERDEDGNPTTLEGVIRSVILKGPDMHQYRDDALCTVYCVLGSGIDWNKHGRLGDHMKNNYMNMPPQAGGQGIWSDDFGKHEAFEGLGKWADGLIEQFKQEDAQRMQSAIDTVQNIDIRVQRYRRDRSSWYPISWYASHIVCPENVQEDFLDGAIETTTLILETEPKLGHNDWMKHRDNVRYAEQMLRLLKAQKEAR